MMRILTSMKELIKRTKWEGLREKRIQRMTIESDEIGDCDNENDPDYKS